ncbi:acetyltransferase [Acinetobacter chinensis]|uniref:Acetyltransferase n=1 Tax=Acinetobacter chinensis TaxID=2004650 RepID=A0ABU3WII6_9GAMM|nr:acetyltransferase [Acinetobacter chinensis]MDV2470199.1 acetyltransferase [Acinetobacter chinensis]
MIDALKPDLIIVGAGGFGKAVAESAKLLDVWNDIFFVDDRWPEVETVSDFHVLSDIKGLRQLDRENRHIIVALGNNTLRKQILAQLSDAGFIITKLIDRKAIVSPSVQIDDGVIIMAGCVISANCRIETGSVLNIGVLLDHDVLIQSYAHLSVGVMVAGGRQVESGSFLEVGTIIGRKLY